MSNEANVPTPVALPLRSELVWLNEDEGYVSVKDANGFEVAQCAVLGTAESWVTVCNQHTELLSSSTRLREQNEAMREALEPLRRITLPANASDHDTIAVIDGRLLYVRDVRAAWAALKATETP